MKNTSEGIPQGSPMSDVLANTYMLEADKEIYECVSTLNGLYMRYSDDFVIVLPNMKEQDAIAELQKISNLFNHSKYSGLELQPSKTQYYRFSDKRIKNCGMIVNSEADCSNQHLNFLGFTFDGEKVSIRDKTVSKFYQRLRRKAKTIVKSNGRTRKGNQISTDNLYIKYSTRGATSKKGNFLTYVNRTLGEELFGASEQIQLVLDRNMYKIRSFLKKK